MTQRTAGRHTASRTPGRPSTRLSVVVLTAAMALATFFGPTSSSAVFTSSSGASGHVAAASDWTPPTVSVTPPAAWVKDVVTVEITAADTEGPVDRVVLERRSPGSDSWANVCTDTTAPFSCTWDTRDLSDGEHALRARATDRAGLEATSTVVRTTVANMVTAVLAAPSTQLRGTVTLTTTLTHIGPMAHTVRVQHADPGSNTWTTICTSQDSPYTCQWDTTGVPAGDRDLRVVVVVGGNGRTLTTSATVTVTVDNVAPSITLTDPGSPLSGTRTFATTASDAHSGVKRVVVQAARTGTSVWSDLCTATSTPWSCQVATTTLGDGTHSFRAAATDAAGNTAISAVVTNRIVENTAPSVVLSALPATLRGTVPVGATASSVPGVTSVKVQYQRSGTTGWTDICTDTSAPYACGWDTVPLANGSYDLRAVMVDALGRTTTSATLSRTVDNIPFSGLDVQTANGSGSTIGKPDDGDTVTFTYSGVIAPSSVLAGWDGTTRTVMVKMNDSGRTIFSGSDEDTFTVVTTSGAAVNLGVLNLMGDYVLNSRTAEFDATMTASTVTAADGTLRSVVTVRLGALQFWSLTAIRGSNHADPAAMVWTPSALVKDIHGRFSTSTPVIETGPLDREF